MNALNRIALLAGGALVAAAATGCSSSTAKPAASGSPANSSTAPGVLSATSSAPGAAFSSSASSASSSGGSAPSTDSPTSAAAPGAASSTAPQKAPTNAPAGHPVCENPDLNASLAPAGSGWKSSVYVIAVKNVGPTCTVKPIPYVWISAGPGNRPEETRPMVPDTNGGNPQIILSGTTLYSAIDLDPTSASNAVAGYTFLDVTANPTSGSSGKDVQDVKLPTPAKVSGAMLSVYATSPSGAIGQIQYATTAEK